MELSNLTDSYILPVSYFFKAGHFLTKLSLRKEINKFACISEQKKKERKIGKTKERKRKEGKDERRQKGKVVGEEGRKYLFMSVI